MSYLIGGPPGAGKTTLGMRLARDLERSSLTIDDIRTGLLAMTTPDTHGDLHLIGMPDAWTYFTETDPETMIDHAFAQHTSLWPAVERVLRKRHFNQQPIVMDGWHLIPHLVSESELDSLRPFWIDIDHGVLEQRERNVWDFYAKSNDPERMFSNFMYRSTTWNDRMAAAARALGLPVLEQDGTRSVEDLVNEVLN